jgi:hypothetical protein
MATKFISNQTFELLPNTISTSSPIFSEWCRISTTVPLLMAIGQNPDPRTGQPYVVPENTIQDLYIENRGDKISLLMIDDPGVDSTVQRGHVSITILEII